MKESIDTRQEFARELVKLNEKSATYGFLEKYGLESLERIKDVAKSEVKSDVSSDKRGETIVYNFLDTINVLNKVSENYYRVEANTGEIEIFRKQLEEDLDDNYGRSELIAYLQVYGEDMEGSQISPIVDYFRERADVPTEERYVANFGSMTYALTVAGFNPRENLDEEDLEDQLRRAIHRKNSDKDVLIETLSAREIDKIEKMHSKSRFRQVFGSIEEAYEEANLQNIRSLEKDLEKWNKITSSSLNMRETEVTDLKAVYPSPNW